MITKCFRTLLGKARHFKRYLKVKDASVARLLMNYGIDPDEVNYDRTTKTLRLRSINFSIRLPNEEWMLERYNVASILVKGGTGEFVRDESLGILFKGSGITVNVQTSEEIFILHEVLVERLYDSRSPKPQIYVDIGMNVGIASLFFASQRDARVLSFEPFPDTFAQAQRNMSLNPELAARITPANVGIGGSSREIVVQYAPTLRGSSGLFEHPAVQSGAINAREVSIQIRNIVEVLQNPLLSEAKNGIIVKMDCEGSEYEILERLNESHLMHKISTIMMEWHRRDPKHDPEKLIATLLENGFVTMSLSDLSAEHGMMYSVRSAIHASAAIA